MSGETGNYPFQIKDLDEEETAEAFKYFTESIQDGFVRIGPEGYFFTSGIREIAPKIYNMALRPDDTWVVTFPKSGTTWMQELVWLVSNNLDYDTATKIPLVARFPCIEILMFTQSKKRPPLDVNDPMLERISKSFEHVTNLPSPRFIKSHLPLSLLPPSLLDTSRVVYVARDPRDVAVSFYHHNLFFKYVGYTGDFKQFWNYFIKDMLDWTPFFPRLKEAWAKRNHPNLLFLFYEDALKDLPGTVKKVADFLGKTMTEEELRRLCEHLSFDNFKKNKSVNMEIMGDMTDKNRAFIRKGKAGGWREMFDSEMTQQAERWMADNLRDTDLRFPTMS